MIGKTISHYKILEKLGSNKNRIPQTINYLNFGGGYEKY